MIPFPANTAAPNDVVAHPTSLGLCLKRLCRGYTGAGREILVGTRTIAKYNKNTFRSSFIRIRNKSHLTRVLLSFVKTRSIVFVVLIIRFSCDRTVHIIDMYDESRMKIGTIALDLISMPYEHASRASTFVTMFVCDNWHITYSIAN